MRRTSPFQPGVNEVKKILSDERLMQVIETDIYRDISFSTIARFDHLLRTKIHTGVTDLLLFIAEVDVNIAVSNVARAKHFGYAKALPKESICWKLPTCATLLCPELLAMIS